MVVTVVLLSGCTAGVPDGRTPLTAGTGAPVIVPGGPGDAGRTARPGERLGESEARVTGADVRFAEGMIPHHRQALEMAALVPARSAAAEVRGLAERITAAQRPEIATMTAWLASVDRAPRGHTGHAAVTPERMSRLRAARGAEFDGLFLTLMIAHHEEALEMAGRQLREGADRTMRAVAGDVMSGQRVEITRMRALLRERV
ncbi:lipoprotein [Streptosporangium violaceochromogenes]|nr:lipoprotein [Streptosporangium violaceochromogenes]